MSEFEGFNLRSWGHTKKSERSKGRIQFTEDLSPLLQKAKSVQSKPQFLRYPSYGRMR